MCVETDYFDRLFYRFEEILFKFSENLAKIYIYL